MSAEQALEDAAARIAALEIRLAALEDDKAIRELLARYGHYADACLDDEYLALFTADCVMDVSSGAAPEPYEVIRWEGLDTMREFLAVRTAAHGDGFYGRSMHAQGNNLTIRVDGATAVANGYSFILHQDGPRIRLVSASVNEWHFVKVDGTWLIKERRRRMLGAPDTATILRASE
ncbi:nuclear transport factor 2 family protein [Phytohabitans suffuscus]|uniref:SnoaL-like domain-containing protein n=1 Tax=Phytohabitans suffuscus TaxID=624315 RepID=A0A6F8YVK4_9ACTN|nr:nuclear transport factor 2 family protein [Phytohabitans suffuscus]BCB89881.1 hypothetical protein Psuf_071940 [Phytohabitans suffuscus]